MWLFAGKRRGLHYVQEHHAVKPPPDFLEHMLNKMKNFRVTHRGLPGPLRLPSPPSYNTPPCEAPMPLSIRPFHYYVRVMRSHYTEHNEKSF